MTFIEEILLELYSNFGWTQGNLERALDLPMYSLKEETPENTALMKMIRIYPWLVEVAEKRYDEIESKRIMCHAAVDIVCNKIANKVSKSKNGEEEN
jgi:hypothetical protein